MPTEATALLPSLEVGPKGASEQPVQPLGSLGPASHPPAFSIDYTLIDSSLIWGAPIKERQSASLSTRDAGE